MAPVAIATHLDRLDRFITLRYKSQFICFNAFHFDRFCPTAAIWSDKTGDLATFVNNLDPLTGVLGRSRRIPTDFEPRRPNL